NVVRKQVNQQCSDAVDELPRLGKRSDVSRHFGVLTGVLLELRNVVRVRKEAHVEDEVAVRRHAVAIAEAGDVDSDLGFIAVAVELVCNQVPQLVDVQLRGV